VGTYFQAFGEIFDTLKERGENELEIIIRVFEAQRYEELEKMDDYAAAYQLAADQLKRLAAPPLFQDFHLAVLHYMAKFKYSVEIFRHTADDPLKTYLAIHERIALNNGFEQLLDSARQKLLANPFNQ